MYKISVRENYKALDLYVQWNIIQPLKKFWNMLQYKWILKTLSYMK